MVSIQCYGTKGNGRLCHWGFEFKVKFKPHSCRTLGGSLFYQPLFPNLVRGDFNPGVWGELNVALPCWTDEIESWFHSLEEDTQTPRDCTDALGTEGMAGTV